MRPSRPRRRPGSTAMMSTRGASAPDSAPRNGRSLSARCSNRPSVTVPRRACEAAEIGRRDLLQARAAASTAPRSRPARPGRAPAGSPASASASRRFARPVRVRGVGAAQRAGDHHRGRAVVGQLEPQRRLLHGVRAVGDDHAVGVRRAATAASARRSRPSPPGSAASCPSHQVDDLDVEPGDQLCAAGRRPLDTVVIGAAGDRSACGDDDEAAHGRIIPKTTPLG